LCRGIIQFYEYGLKKEYKVEAIIKYNLYKL